MTQSSVFVRNPASGRRPSPAAPLVLFTCLLGLLGGLGNANAQVPIIQPGAPGQPVRVLTPEQAVEVAVVRYADADVSFLQGMISHHSQAMEMSALADTRALTEEVKSLAGRIALSQEDEIAMMQGWLEDGGFEVPAAHAHHAGDFELMPGMATPEEMAALEQASGSEFDRLYLERMIEHHNGALEMVDDLLNQYGAARNPALYAFTSDVTSDQTSEIERMDTMLAGFSPDPRVGLAAGFADAGQAALNMRLVASLPKPPGFYDPENPSGLPSQMPASPAVQGTDDGDDEDEDDEEAEEARPSLLGFSNTEILFSGSLMVVSNYHGFNFYDIANPAAPELLSSVVCPGGQGDISLVGNLLIVSVEERRGRLDCGLQGIADPVSEMRVRGIRLFDVSDPRLPFQVGVVQTCRGSHTHTVVSEEDENGNIYVYVSGTSGVRDDEELTGCSDDSPFENPESALFRIEVIEIPKDRPQDARIVNRPFIFADPETGVLAGLWRGGDHGPDTQQTSQTNQCHDITTFPEIGLAAGACSGNGILLDISDPADPKRLDQVIDPGFAYWHSATFNNDGSKVIFTDEWGGGGRARCRAQDPKNWGADAFYDIVDGKLQFRSHFKLPAPQSDTENCVAHNGALVPVPGRDIFVQSWYQGGISVVDFTDSSNPVEIAFFDRGPMDEEKIVSAGYWSSYWYGGYVFGTEIARGLDVFTLEPSDYLSENEIAAASTGQSGRAVNAQNQTRITWPQVPVVARAYRDQLVRSDSLAPGQLGQLDATLARAEQALGNGGSDRDAAASLEDLARAFGQQATGASGITQQRLAGLAGTLEGMARSLR